MPHGCSEEDLDKRRARMAKTIADIMQTSIVSVAPHDPLHSVQRLFFESGIQAAPVVDDQSRLLGIITSTDILRAAADNWDAPTPEPTSSDGEVLGSCSWLMEPEEFRESLRHDVVEDFMTEHVLCVLPETTVADVARMLRSHRVHHVLVTEGEEIRGIASAFDLISLIED
jgi:CBS domain-containing protein